MAGEGSRVLFQGSSGAWYAISPALAVKVARNDSTSSESETLEKLAAQWPSAEGKYEGLGPYEQLRVLEPIKFGTIADLQRIYQFGFTQMMSRNASAFVTERLYPVPGETDFTLVELGQGQSRAKLASFGMDLEAVCYELGRFLGFGLMVHSEDLESVHMYVSDSTVDEDVFVGRSRTVRISSISLILLRIHSRLLNYPTHADHVERPRSCLVSTTVIIVHKLKDCIFCLADQRLVNLKSSDAKELARTKLPTGRRALIRAQQEWGQYVQDGERKFIVLNNNMIVGISSDEWTKAKPDIEKLRDEQKPKTPKAERKEHSRAEAEDSLRILAKKAGARTSFVLCGFEEVVPFVTYIDDRGVQEMDEVYMGCGAPEARDYVQKNRTTQGIPQVLAGALDEAILSNPRLCGGGKTMFRYSAEKHPAQMHPAFVEISSQRDVTIP